MFCAVTIVTVHIYAQPCINTAKQLDSLVEELKQSIPVNQRTSEWIGNMNESLNNWQNNFPIQLCKKLPLFETENRQEYTTIQRAIEYWTLLNFYRHSNDSIMKNYRY